MLFVLQRSFTYFTMVFCVLVAGLSLRVLSPELTSLEVSTEYLSVFKSTQIQSSSDIEIAAPEMKFAAIKFPEVIVPKKVIAKAKATVAAPKMTVTNVSKELLPFAETMKVEPVRANIELPKNLIALYKNIEVAPAAQMVAETLKTDEVSTKLAATEEPEFFEYPTEEPAKAAAPVEEKVKEVVEEKMIAEAPEATDTVNPSSVVEEESIGDLVTYDYSNPAPVAAAAAAPVVTHPAKIAEKSVTTQNTFVGQIIPLPQVNIPAEPVAVKPVKSNPVVTTQTPVIASHDKAQEENMNFLTAPAPKTYSVKLNIHAVSTDLQGSHDTQGFDVRLMDDQSASLEDFGSGEVVLNDEISSPKMSRTISMLKPGFAPTTTDAILEEGESTMSIPLIQSEAFNEAIAPFEGNGPVGAVLVELDDKTEYAQIDVPFGKSINLDGDLKVTTSEDFRYQLFMGVKAGNVLLSYKVGKNQNASKIIHVHEAEVTYDANFFEKAQTNNISLMEEDLLSKQENPLIVGADLVKQFATDKTSQKIDDHTYKMNFGSVLLGARKYLELDHQQEPIFVGFRNAKKVSVPSESFMRYILSSFEGKGIANRCVIQVNLTSKILSVESGSESVAEGLVTQVQYLDRDGKFYNSASENTRKVIILGENQGSEQVSKDGKVNLKVSYRDGSVEYLGSYCSPNTYLVEQL